MIESIMGHHKISFLKSLVSYICKTQIDIHPLIDLKSMFDFYVTDTCTSDICLFSHSQIGVLSRAKACICFYLVTWWMWVNFVHDLHCILYKMNAKCKISSHKFNAPDQCLSTQKKLINADSFPPFLSSRIRHLVLSLLRHCLTKSALTGVTSLYVDLRIWKRT